MGFLSPWFLAGLLAVGLPLWLHLLRRSQHTPRPFSSLMFFEKRIETSSKHRQLRYLALLSARLAILILLALAFASPFINRTTSTLRKQTAVVIAIDRSFSMRGGKRLEQAKAQAHAVVRGLTGRQAAQVIAFDRRVENMTGLEFSRATMDAAIDAIQPTDLDSSLGELVRALHVLAQAKDTILDVHLFSDMQQTSMPQDFRDLALGDSAALHTYRVGAVAPNWAVETVATSPHVYDVKRTELSATVTGWHTPASSQRAELLLDGKTLDSKEVAVPANGRGEVEFRGFNVPYGQHRGEVRIVSSDTLPQDNRFFFSVERRDPRRVLFLYARGRTRQFFYYKSALDAAIDTGLQVDTVPLEQVAAQDLSRYAFVILHDPGSLDKGAEQKLCQYVRGGGAALVAMGPDTAQSGRLPLSKLSLTGSKDSQGVGFLDGQHPALAGGGRLDTVQFFSTARWRPPAQDRVLAKLADDAPLLVEEPMGEGRVLQFAATLDNTTSDFPLHSAYLPFVAQTGRYLAGGEDAQSSYPAGTAITLRKTRDSKAATDVTGPDGRHEISLTQSKHDSSFEVDREGFYEVARADGRRQLVAAHADRRESDLRTISDETLELWRNTGSTAAAANRNTAGTNTTETKPWSFWRYVLVLVVVAALIESVIARRYAQEGQRNA